jgi:hypothetical protein
MKTEKKKGPAGASLYTIIELVGTSKTSWEDAVKNAVQAASKSLEDLRIAEIVKLDVSIENGKITAYRARLNVSFRYHAGL